MDGQVNYPAAYAAASHLVDEARAAFATVGPAPPSAAAASPHPASFFAASHRAGGGDGAAEEADDAPGQPQASAEDGSGGGRGGGRGGGGGGPQALKATHLAAGVHEPPADPFAEVASSGRRTGRPGTGRSTAASRSGRTSASPSVRQRRPPLTRAVASPPPSAPRLCLQGRVQSPGRLRTAASQATVGGTSRVRARLSAARESTHRLTSVAGAAHIERQETARLMRRSLGLAHGVAFEVYPQRGTLPPFGTAVIQIAAVADLPGDYTDVLELRMDGVPDRLVPVSARVSGNPLTFAPTTAGLNLAGWGGTVGPTLSFGEHPEGASALARHVTVINASPMDAHLTWHLAGDRHPAAAVPPCSVDIVANALPELSIDDATASSEALVRGGWRPVTVTIRAQSDRAPAGVDLPFAVYPPTLTVPAYGKAVMKVGAPPPPPGPPVSVSHARPPRSRAGLCDAARRRCVGCRARAHARLVRV